MGSYPRQTNVCHAPKKKITVSFTIRDEEEKYHRSGVNSLQHDANLHRLYSAGRDSIIRIWDVTPDNQLSSHRVSSADSLRSHHRHRHHANGTNIIDNNNGSYDSRHNNHNSINNNHATTSSNIRRTNVKDYYIKSMEHHTDWVNDIILCRNGQNLISVSSDTTIKVWNAHSGFCLSTLRSHRDYVKCLAYAQDKEYVASACFEGVIYLWDVMTLTSLTSVKSTVTTKTLEGCKNSIYSLATNPAGTLVASGSTEKVIRLWDPRTRQKLLKLRGHSDNVRTLLLSPDGTQLVSGSSDGTVRLWSIGQQRCIATLRCHEEGVWSVSCNSSFDTIYSGGKDRRIYATHVNNSTNSVLVCQESAPILRLLHESTKDTLWAATTDSCLRNWSVRHANEHLINGGAPLNGGGSPQSSPSSSSSYSSSLYGQPDNHMTNVIPTTSEDSKHSSMNGLDQSCNYQRQHQQNSRRHPHQHPKPQRTIPGNPSIVSYHVLNDRRHILTRASDNSMALYDVLSAEKIEDIVA
ncbi:WD repeat-containing protein 48-like protein, partial [Fragariocoptes setiger]